MKHEDTVEQQKIMIENTKGIIRQKLAQIKIITRISKHKISTKVTSQRKKSWNNIVEQIITDKIKLQIVQTIINIRKLHKVRNIIPNKQQNTPKQGMKDPIIEKVKIKIPTQIRAKRIKNNRIMIKDKHMQNINKSKITKIRQLNDKSI